MIKQVLNLVITKHCNFCVTQNKLLIFAPNVRLQSSFARASQVAIAEVTSSNFFEALTFLQAPFSFSHLKWKINCGHHVEH